MGRLGGEEGEWEGWGGRRVRGKAGGEEGEC